AVPGLAAKPIIDIDLTVADPGREDDYVPPLEAAGFRLTIREPWWHGHRLLRADEPSCNLHVFGFDSPELVKHRIFRDWLRGNPDERERYASAKRQAASEANSAGEHVMLYNARKQQVIREIYQRAFTAAGLLES
ncbi:MAG: GrpB family protein, partial [Kitasatospora sp.]|nr:GrpB family protein [Kitasatospora sp.]